eukprot:12299741-Alexandrium_andersonii.AAC.1
MTQEVRPQTGPQQLSEVGGMGQLAEGSPGVPHAPNANVPLGSADFSFSGGARTPEAHLALDYEPLARHSRRGLGLLLGLA